MERAVQLAQSGYVLNVAGIKSAMLREGYSTGEIEGEQLRTQLRALIKAARGRSGRSRDSRAENISYGFS